MTVSLLAVVHDPGRGRGLGDSDAPPARCGKCSNKKRLRRIGDKRDWVSRNNFDFGSPSSATVQLSVQTGDPGARSVSRGRKSVLLAHDVRCTLRLVMWGWACWVERGQKGGRPGREIWLEGRRVCAIISWASINKSLPLFAWVPRTCDLETDRISFPHQNLRLWTTNCSKTAERVPNFYYTDIF